MSSIHSKKKKSCSNTFFLAIRAFSYHKFFSGKISHLIFFYILNDSTFFFHFPLQRAPIQRTNPALRNINGTIKRDFFLAGASDRSSRTRRRLPICCFIFSVCRRIDMSLDRKSRRIYQFLDVWHLHLTIEAIFKTEDADPDWPCDLGENKKCKIK